MLLKLIISILDGLVLFVVEYDENIWLLKELYVRFYDFKRNYHHLISVC